MKRKTRRVLLAFFVGVLLGAGGMTRPYLKARHDVQKLKRAQAATLNYWLSERQEWAAGKSFRYHYGQHRRRW